jgi:Cohesin domain
MTLRILCFATLLAINSLCSTLSAQLPPVSLSLPTYEQTNTGDILSFPVTVENFQSITGLSFMIRWDPAVLEFQALDLGANPMGLIDTSHFNINQVNLGQFRCARGGSPKTVPNGAALFQLQMKVIGGNGSSTDVYFTESTSFPSIYFEIVREPGPQFFNLNNTTLTQGEVTVGIVSAPEPTVVRPLMQVIPNPIQDAAQLTFSMPSAKAVELNIVNVLGQQVVSRVIDAQKGVNTYALDRDIFPVAGLYYVTLQHQQGRSVYPLWVH